MTRIKGIIFQKEVMEDWERLRIGRSWTAAVVSSAGWLGLHGSVKREREQQSDFSQTLIFIKFIKMFYHQS